MDEVLEQVARAQRGDGAAMAGLLAKYEPLLRKHVRELHRRLAWTDSSLEVDDLIQETRVMFLELVAEYDPNRHVPFGRYLMVKLGWRAVNFLREERLRLRRELVYDHHVLQQVLAEDERLATHAPEHDVLIAEGVRRLTAHQRRVFILHNLQGRSTAEVGALLGLTPREIRRVRERALKRLRRELAELKGA
jgi:RNA polymerase sigma factor (sigma-70 family)